MGKIKNRESGAWFLSLKIIYTALIPKKPSEPIAATLPDSFLVSCAKILMNVTNSRYIACLIFYFLSL